jgi:hypothetical protein
LAQREFSESRKNSLRNSEGRKYGKQKSTVEKPQAVREGREWQPGGKPVGSCSRIQREFLKALAEDFAAHGREAIIQCSLTKSDAYIKVVAAPMLKELELKRPRKGLAEDELEVLSSFLRAELQAGTAH